ncbi:MAG: galactose-1-phosphate uridylyltransferase, partial [Methanobacteriota archaeon]
MPEIRKDYATDTWVVFSAARSRRPGAFRNAKASTPKDDCPFCVGHEAMTPPEVLAYRDRGPKNGPGWRIRCVPNMFPALEASGDVRRHGDGLFVSVDGVGAHEIIVESPDHEGRI